MAAEAGHGLRLEVVHTSVLTRAVRTANLALDAMERSWLPVRRHWRLNERHYGALQGLNKKETTEKYGLEQVKVWRRSYDVPPPPLSPDDERHPRHDARYRALPADALPATECLKDVVARMVPYWEDAIAGDLHATGGVLVVAHGNSIRALVKYLKGIPDEEIVALEVPTGVPWWFRLDDELAVIDDRQLGDPSRHRGGGRGHRPSGGLTLKGRRAPVRRCAPAPPARRGRPTPCRHRSCRWRRLRTTASTTSSVWRVVDEYLDPDLGHEVHLVLRTAVDLGVAPLAAEALRLGEGHALDPKGLQGLLDLVELERLEHRHDQLHCRCPLSSSLGPVSSCSRPGAW